MKDEKEWDDVNDLQQWKVLKTSWQSIKSNIER